MIVAGSASPLLLSSAGGYNLTNSLRFRASASAYLNRTPASSGNLNLWTLSWWTKRGQLSTAAQTTMFGTDYASSQEFMLQFTANNRLVFEQYASGGAINLGNLISTQVFRDPSAWYHIVVTWDSAQATASNRIKIYVNGSQITAWDTASYPAQNASSVWNQSTNEHRIGQYSTAKYYDGYMGEVNFIDGQALTPSSFGETSATTGVWIPKKYTGTYGTNGFYLPFTDNSALTTSSNVGLGKDFSGNSNYWTTNNISITAGSTYDSMTDVPTLTSATAANYATLNPLANPVGTLANGNLQISTTTDSKVTTATMALPSTGQYYFEITATDYATGGGVSLGLVNSPFLTTFPANGTYIGIGTYSGSYNNGTSIDTTNLTGTDVTNDGDIWCIAIDVTNNKFWAGRSRSGTLVWADGVTPAVNGSGASTLSLPTGDLYPMIYRGGSYNEIYNFNFGQQPFAHTPPTGFVRLNTFNLPTPTIGATASTTANKYFDVTLYTGTGATQTITNSGSMQPDFLWLKQRGNATSHCLTDNVRGVNSQLISNSTDAEYTATDCVTAINSNGFTLGANTQTAPNVNFTVGGTFVGWQWKANGAGSSNTAGTITSTVSANTSAGFSIVTYTGTGSNATVGHGLGVAPSWIITKYRGVESWAVYHKSTGNTQYLTLDTTNAAASASTVWQNTSPTSTVFSVGTAGLVNTSGGSGMVAYCFAPVAGYSAFGSYTGNGSNDGPFIYTGFRPRYIMIKRTDAAQSWWITDTARNPYNTCNLDLFANLSNAEENNGYNLDLTSNGVKIRTSTNDRNASGGTYIYMAFCESPFKFSNAR